MMINSWLALFFVTILLSSVLTIPSVLADSWYVGKGLKQGDYFRYNVCWIDWHNCAPLEIDFWVKNQTSDGNWNLQFLAIDGSISQAGMVTIGSIYSDPINYTSNLADYATVFKNTIVWLDTFTNKDVPKDFSYPFWGRQGIVDGESIEPIGQEQVTVQAGSYKAWLIGWHRGVVDNKIWVVPSIPFPIKAETYADVAQGTPPLQFRFELLQTGNSQTSLSLGYLNATAQFVRILTPLEQISNGILPENVVCSDSLVLIKKLSDNSPACVKLQTAKKLVERGWGILIVSTTEQSNNSIILPNAIKVSNANFTLNYDITGGKVTQIKQDTESKSFIISVQTTSDGKLTIKVPRIFYDAKMSNGNDDKFVILVDGQEIAYTETKTSTDRTVTIPFTQGTQQIEFIGTQILSGH